MTNKTIIGVAGSGAMGSGIAQVAAMAGHPVIIFDTDNTALERAKSGIAKSTDKFVEKGKIASAGIITDAISYSENIRDFAPCSLVIEAIVENIEIKKKLFSSMEQHVNSECILATNTSSLPVVAVAAACKKRERVIGIHFFNPAALMPLVEIIPAFTTATHVTEQARALINLWGKTTVIAKDTPGFIVNRVARPYYGEAIKMYEEGIAGFETIDWAMKEFGGFKMGPFELMDFIGNDINYKVTETVWEQLFFDARYRPSLTQKRLFEAGFFGRKTGRGYYDYDASSLQPEPERNQVKGKYIFNRILAMLVNEAVDALYLNIASSDDIETAMTKGVNYPKGLLSWGETVGLDVILKSLNELQADYGDDRYRPSLLLKKMVAEKRSFF